MNNNTFIWTDELVAEFTTWSLTKSNTFQGRYADIEEFKESKQPKKEYEILRVIDPNIIPDPKLPFRHTIQINGKEWDNPNCSDGGLRKFPIHSVKRLIDNEELKIDDTIKINYYTGVYKIKSFEIDSTGLCIYVHGVQSALCINDIQKVKQPTNVFNHEKINEQLIEIEKCQKSPYYFATTYLTVNGKPFKTHLSEESFNKYVADKEGWIKSFQTVKTQSQQPTKLYSETEVVNFIKQLFPILNDASIESIKIMLQNKN